jgi:hypothetical protein
MATMDNAAARNVKIPDWVQLGVLVIPSEEHLLTRRKQLEDLIVRLGASHTQSESFVDAHEAARRPAAVQAYRDQLTSLDIPRAVAWINTDRTRFALTGENVHPIHGGGSWGFEMWKEGWESDDRLPADLAVREAWLAQRAAYNAGERAKEAADLAARTGLTVVAPDDQARSYFRGTVADFMTKQFKRSAGVNCCVLDVRDVEGTGGGYYFLHRRDAGSNTVEVVPLANEDANIFLGEVSRRTQLAEAKRLGITHMTTLDLEDRPVVRSILTALRT